MNPGLCRNGNVEILSPIQFQIFRAGVLLVILSSCCSGDRSVKLEKLYSDHKLSPESGRYGHEQLSIEKVSHLGNLALNKSEFLGINDPLTHLCQYLENGQDAITGIKIDLETDVAERLPKTPFINHVGFEFIGDDFVSVKDRVSMNSMTQTNLNVMKKIEKRPDLKQEIERAKLEADEVRKLTNWYKAAPDYSYIIFESLPIGSQKIAISRIYQKQPGDRLQGSFVSLYEPSVNTFNQLRKDINPLLQECDSEIEILKNNYDFYAPNLKSPDNFIDFYVETYDKILFSASGAESSFGLPGPENTKINGLEKIKKQPKLSAIYIDAIQNLASSGGFASKELQDMNKKLGLSYAFESGSKIPIETARGFLSDVIRGIASVIDNADGDFLRYLETTETKTDTSYAALSCYQTQSRELGQSYDSLACPEFINDISDDSSKQSSFEQDAMLRAFNIWESLDFFGQPKIDVCRTDNCPSRGTAKSFKDRTVVGGCGFCVECHKILQKNKSPEKIYQEKIKKQKSKIDKNKKNTKNNKFKAA